MAPALHTQKALLAAAVAAGRQLPRASPVAAAGRALQLQQRRGYATPKGAPPKAFRTSKPVEFAWEKDNTLDKMGKYFLMTELARGMYVLMEQFFRAP